MAESCTVLRGPVESSGKAPWAVVGTPLVGKSKTPLLDACRKIIASGGDPAREVYLRVADRDYYIERVVCGVGAGLSVDESNAGRVRFRPYVEREFPDRE